MRIYALAAVITNVCSAESTVLSGGILLEESGKLFLTRQRSHHHIVISRPIPLNVLRMEHEVDYRDCDVDRCIKRYKANRWDKKECIANLANNRTFSLLAVIERKFKLELASLEAEAAYVRRHESHLAKRLAGAPALVLAAANLAVKLKNTNDIAKLRSVSLHQGRNLDKLTRNFAKLQSAVQVNLNATKDELARIDSDLCLLNNRMLEARFEDWARITVDNFMQEVDYEVAALQQGLIPSRVEWNRLFTSACWGSCIALEPEMCELHCQDLLREYPQELKPELYGLNITENALDIHIQLSFPIIESAPTRLYQANPFGIIIKDTSTKDNVLIAPDIAPFATMIQNEFYELDRFSCLSSRRNMICRHSAILSASCLRDVQNCNIKKTMTSATCSFAFDKNGLIIFAAETAILRNRTVLSDIGSAHDTFTGFKYFAETSLDQEVFCSGSNQLIKIPKTSIVTSDNAKIDLRVARNNFTFKAVDLDNDNFIDDVEDRLDDLEDVVDDNYIKAKSVSLISNGILLLITFTTLILFTCQFLRRVRGLDQTINRALKPLI